MPSSLPICEHAKAGLAKAKQLMVCCWCVCSAGRGSRGGWCGVCGER